MVPIYSLLVSIWCRGVGWGVLGKHCLGNVVLVAVDNVFCLETQVGKAGLLWLTVYVHREEVDGCSIPAQVSQWLDLVPQPRLLDELHVSRTLTALGACSSHVHQTSVGSHS